MIYDDCSLITLANGIDVLAEMVKPKSKEDTGPFTLVKNPIIVEATPSQEKPGQIGVGFRPYSFFLEPGATVAIMDRFILSITKPNKEIFGQYNQMFGSNIVIPQVNPPKGPLTIVK